MSQGALFAFGSGIFLIVLSGAFMYAVQKTREWAKREM
ncbi:MAG: hypothetical protein RL547_1803 [Actinomycetota bacterium]|jgi:hypothetical protein